MTSTSAGGAVRVAPGAGVTSGPVAAAASRGTTPSTAVRMAARTATDTPRLRQARVALGDAIAICAQKRADVSGTQAVDGVGALRQ